MKYFKVIIALVLTLIFLFIAKNNAMNRPSFYSASQGNYSIEYLSTPKVFEKEPYTIQIKVIGQLSDSIFPVVRRINLGDDPNADIRRYNVSKMQVEDSSSQIFSFSGFSGARGGKTFYYFEVRGMTGKPKVVLTPSESKPFTLKYIGHVPVAVLISHIVLMFLSIFFIILAAVHAIAFLRGEDNLLQIAQYTLLASFACFLGGYPFGFAMNWYAFNGFWEGVPFGTDATDNKTQLLFAYLLFAVIAMRGSLYKKPELNLYSDKTTGYIAIGSFLVMTFVNLIPHSIQFSKSFTEIFCYSFIGMVFILTVYPIIKKQ